MSNVTTTIEAHDMHETQQVYALARAAYETARAVAKAECEAKGLIITRDMPDAEWERVCDARDDIEVAHGVWSFQTLRVEAERAMILWSFDACEARFPEHAATIGFMRARMVDRRVYGKEWEKLVDLAFHLADKRGAEPRQAA